MDLAGTHVIAMLPSSRDMTEAEATSFDPIMERRLRAEALFK
jgi:hypothetical protein